MKYLKNKNGAVLLLTILMMSLILFLMLYFINFSLTESKISRSQSIGGKTYYLAEAGISEMIWKLKNDPVFKENFETNPAWQTSFTRTDPFGPNTGTYQVSITNSSLAHGDIVSTANINIGNNKTTQRVIRTSIYKALGQTGIQNNAGYADGNIEITNSNVNYVGGGAHSNNVFDIKNGSTVNIAGDLEATGNYLTSGAASTVNVTGSIYAANQPLGPAAEIVMPAIDFNSADPASLKNSAVSVYTPSQFEDLIEDNPNLVLPDGITYVTGNAVLDDLSSLTINGALVVEGDLTIGTDNTPTSITINHLEGQPSGLIASNKITIDEKVNAVTIQGIIYGSNLVTVKNIDSGHDFNVTGGIVGRKLTIEGCSRTINIIYDNDVLVDVLRATEFSPVILVDHWEEEY